IGINTDFFQPAGVPLYLRHKRVLFVGRMVEKKGPLLMIQAFSRVYREVPEAELIMVGDGPMRMTAEQLACELGVPVIFTGALSSIQVLEQLHKVRVFCLPSVTAANGDAEGFGMVILEAQACGVPVVSSARGGSIEGIVDGVTGFQCNEGDIICIADRLLRCLLDEDLAKRMSESAIKFVHENFNLIEQTKKIEKIYEQFVTSCNRTYANEVRDEI
ncbi:MAG: glycosyltransferase, partial [Ferruginibacter sp.]